MGFDFRIAVNNWGTLAALIIALGSAVISFRAARAAKVSADASVRQAAAAEEQAKAIPAQLAAAQTAAEAAKKQAELALRTADEAKKIAQLSETQIKASLRPILVIERRPPSLRDPTDFIVNTGEGPASNITARYATGIPPSEISAPNILAAHNDARTHVDWSRVQQETIYLSYESQDGRKFRTHVGVDSAWHPTHTHTESS